MATPEFSVYLAVLGRSLQLSASESRELAAELSDHFDERLADLLDAGVERSRAVRLVLDEFGEAAELAARFSDLASRRQRRRWMMRFTLGTCVAGAAIAAFVLLTPSPIPVAPTAVAQAPAAAQTPAAASSPATPAPSQSKPILSRPVDPTSAAIEEKLESSILADVQLQEVPLSEALEFIGDHAGVDIVLDRTWSYNADVTLDHPVTLQLRRSPTSTRAVLQLLVDQLGNSGDFLVRNGVVVIGEQAGLTSTRIYDCRGVIERVGHVHPIVEAIRRNVSPDDWRREGVYTSALTAGLTGSGAMGPGAMGAEGAASGPPGMPGGMMMEGGTFGGGLGGGGMSGSEDDMGKTAAISCVGGLLVVTQTPQAHRQIADLLRQLELVLAAQ